MGKEGDRALSVTAFLVVERVVRGDADGAVFGVGSIVWNAFVSFAVRRALWEGDVTGDEKTEFFFCARGVDVFTGDEDTTFLFRALGVGVFTGDEEPNEGFWDGVASRSTSIYTRLKRAFFFGRESMSSSFSNRCFKMIGTMSSA